MRWSQGLPQRELIYETLFQTREMRRRTEAESENFRRRFFQQKRSRQRPEKSRGQNQS